jgi:hypothetical protein
VAWLNLVNDESRDLCFSPEFIWLIKSKRMSWAVHATRMGDKRSKCRILARKTEGKSLLGRPKL